MSFWGFPGTVSCIAGPTYICTGCVDPLAVFFSHDCIYIWGLYFVRRLRGSAPAAFWLLPADALWPLGVVVVVIFLHRLFRFVSANT